MVQHISGSKRLHRVVVSTEGKDIGFETVSEEEGIVAAGVVRKLMLETGLKKGITSRGLRDILRRLARLIAVRKSLMATTAADRLDIPWSYTAMSGYPTVALGHGKNRQLFWKHIPPGASEIGVEIADHKTLATEALRRVGLPVTNSKLIANIDEALAFARQNGWPVVIKPNGGGTGAGVFPQIEDEATLRDCFNKAREHGSLLIENHVQGDTYRILVHNDNCIVVLHKEPALVICDGVHSVQELVDRENEGRAKSTDEDLFPIKIDQDAISILRRQGYELTDIPPADETVYTRFLSGATFGGKLNFMTSGVHPDNLRMAVKATSTLRMELAGIDFITADITRSCFEVDCAILEINTNPHFAWGKRKIATQDMIMNAYFPAPERGRIPVVAMLCADGQEPLRHLLASVINAHAQPVVVVNKEGAFVDGSRIAVAKENLSRRIELALSDYAAGSVFSTFSITELLQSGLGVDRIELLVIPGPIHSDDDKMISHISEVAKSIVASAPVIAEIAGKVDELPSLWCVGEVSSELPSRQDINRVFRDSDQPKSVTIEQPGKPDQQADIADDSTDDHLIAVAVAAALAPTREEIN